MPLVFDRGPRLVPLLVSASIIALNDELLTVLGSIVIVFTLLALFNVIINRAVYDADGTLVKPQLKLRWDILLKFMFATMDLATDALFMREMHEDPLTSDIFWVSLGFFIFSTVCCGVAVYDTLKQLNKSKHADAATADTFEIWTRNNDRVCVYHLLHAQRRPRLSVLQLPHPAAESHERPRVHGVAGQDRGAGPRRGRHGGRAAAVHADLGDFPHGDGRIER